MCELTQKWYNDGEKTGTAKTLIKSMDNLKFSIEVAMQAIEIPDTEKPFYVNNIRSGKVKCE